MQIARFSCATGSLRKKGAVWISRLTSPFANLALENWLLRNFCLTDTDVLFMWRDEPSVVIGRHQNPWAEANVFYLNRERVMLVRRHSGGGTVYHDENNLNCSFLTDRTRHCRLRNLDFICEALRRDFGLASLSVNKKHDIVMDNIYKVSGTAAKLVRAAAYHHLTLLLQVDRERMYSALQPSFTGIHSSATKSVPSAVAGLAQKHSGLTYEAVVDCLRQNFLRHYSDNGLPTQFVDAVGEDVFPGIGAMIAELRSWEWTFGATPQFSIKRLSDETPFVIENGHITTGCYSACATTDNAIMMSELASLANLVSLSEREVALSDAARYFPRNVISNARSDEVAAAAEIS